jgi:hypothetical protein
VLSHRVDGDSTTAGFSVFGIMVPFSDAKWASASVALESTLCLLQLSSISDLGEPEADDMDVRGLTSTERSELFRRDVKPKLKFMLKIWLARRRRLFLRFGKDHGAALTGFDAMGADWGSNDGSGLLVTSILKVFEG